MRRLAAGLICLLLLLIPTAVWAEEALIIHTLAPDDPRPVLPQNDLLEVHLINVASADCILLRMGNQTMLIDSGNRTTVDRILAYLDAIGVDRLDYAFLTHPHNDHLSGFLTVLKEVPAGIFLEADLYQDFVSERSRELSRMLASLSIPVQTITHDTHAVFGGATLSFYQWAGGGTVNECSMIVRVSYGDRAILLAADVENNGQKALAETLGSDLRADILKMPHHGLVTLTRSFYEAIQPRLVTFSNVKENIKSTIGQAEQRGLSWMLTTKGTIVAVTDGEIWTVWQVPRE